MTSHPTMLYAVFDPAPKLSEKGVDIVFTCPEDVSQLKGQISILKEDRERLGKYVADLELEVSDLETENEKLKKKIKKLKRELKK